MRQDLRGCLNRNSTPGTLCCRTVVTRSLLAGCEGLNADVEKLCAGILENTECWHGTQLIEGLEQDLTVRGKAGGEGR